MAYGASGSELVSEDRITLNTLIGAFSLLISLVSIITVAVRLTSTINKSEANLKELINANKSNVDTVIAALKATLDEKSNISKEALESKILAYEKACHSEIMATNIALSQSISEVEKALRQGLNEIEKTLSEKSSANKETIATLRHTIDIGFGAFDRKEELAEKDAELLRKDLKALLRSQNAKIYNLEKIAQKAHGYQVREEPELDIDIGTPSII